MRTLLGRRVGERSPVSPFVKPARPRPLGLTRRADKSCSFCDDRVIISRPQAVYSVPRGVRIMQYDSVLARRTSGRRVRCKSGAAAVARVPIAFLHVRMWCFAYRIFCGRPLTLDRNRTAGFGRSFYTFLFRCTGKNFC